MDKRCYICGSSRHLRSTCPRRHSIPVSEDDTNYNRLCSNFNEKCSTQPSYGRGARHTYRRPGDGNDFTTENNYRTHYSHNLYPQDRSSVRSCNICGKYNHFSRDCWFRNDEVVPRSGWYPKENDYRRPNNSHRPDFRQSRPIHQENRYSNSAGGNSNNWKNSSVYGQHVRDKNSFNQSDHSTGQDDSSSCSKHSSSKRDNSRQLRLTESSSSPEQRTHGPSTRLANASADNRYHETGAVARKYATYQNGGNDMMMNGHHESPTSYSTEKSFPSGVEYPRVDHHNSSGFGEEECCYEDQWASSRRRRPRRRPVPQYYGHIANNTMEQDQVLTEQRDEDDPVETRRNEFASQSGNRRDTRRGGKYPSTVIGRGRVNSNFRLFEDNVVVCYNCGRSGHKSFDCPESGLNRIKANNSSK